MYKYQMDPTKTVGATEWTQNDGQTDGRTDGGRTDGRTEWNRYIPQQLRCVGGIMNTKIILTHYDVIKWKHFPRYWPFVQGIHRSPVNSPHKGQWRGTLMFSLIYAWINGWVNNREAGDLRRHRTHYDVSVMGPTDVPAAKCFYIYIYILYCIATGHQ